MIAFHPDSALNSAHGFQHTHCAEIDSTNAELLRRAQNGVIHRTALSADFQTTGRGQRGRTWRARRGEAVLLSVAWTFPKTTRLDGLSLAVGVAVSEAIDASDFGAHNLLLKWPNDLLRPEPNGIALGKLGGILIETTPTQADQRTAVIGVGINLLAPERLSDTHAAPDDAPAEMPAAALLSATSEVTEPARNALIDRLLSALGASLQRFSDQGFAPFQARWWQRRAFAGDSIQVLVPDGTTRTGVIAAITEQGALVIETADGRHTLVSGAVSLRPLTP